MPELAPEQRVTTHAALQAAAPHLRAELGRQVRLKYTPELTFREDPAIEAGNRIESIIRDLHRDETQRREPRMTVTEVDASLARTPRTPSPMPTRSRWPATSTPTATPSARCSGSSTCCAPPAATSWRRSRSRSSVAPHYRELPGLDLLTHPAEFPTEPDVMVTFDCGSLGRLGDLEPAAKAARELIVLDHHVSNTRYGTINVIDPAAAASGVLVRRLVAELGLPLTNEAAVALYAAIVCDTGRFQYETTTPSVFELARELVAFDVPVSRLSRQLFEEHRFAYLKLLGEALAERRARRRAPLRLDRRHPGHARRATASPSKRSRASSTSCAGPARPRSRAW